MGIQALPIRPDAGKDRLPVKKALLADKALGFSQQFDETRTLRWLHRDLGPAQRDLYGVYQRLTEKGKPHKVATVAVMRKLLILANVLIRDDREWASLAPAPIAA